MVTITVYQCVYKCVFCYVFLRTAMSSVLPSDLGMERRKTVNMSELSLQEYMRWRHRPEQLEQQSLVFGLSQVMDQVSQGSLSGLQLPKQNLWGKKKQKSG